MYNLSKLVDVLLKLQFSEIREDDTAYNEAWEEALKLWPFNELKGLEDELRKLTRRVSSLEKNEEAVKSRLRILEKKCGLPVGN